MNFAEIENLRSQTALLLPRLSGMPRIILLNHFYETLFATNNELLIDAFCQEFINEYIASFELYDPHYFSPEKSKNYLNTLNQLSKIDSLSDYLDKIAVTVEQIQNRTVNFTEQLNSRTHNSQEKGELYFPLIGTITITNKTLYYNSIEKVSIKISAAKQKDKFVFVPSSHRKEKLEEQAKISFELAKNFVKAHKHKLTKHHEVLIYFENLSAEYEGNSLGIALTIGFIEQLSILYNLPYVTKIKGNIVSTGGININGDLISLEDSICSQKSSAVFFSSFDTFIIPKAVEQTSLQTIEPLKAMFPNRSLRIVAVESLNDLLERRSLIEFKKQSPLVRSSRFIRTNWIASLLLLLLTLILLFIYVRDFDDNPASFEASGQAVLIKNKSGKTLWKKAHLIDHKVLPSETYEKAQYMIIDVNNDGVKEVILTNEIFTDSKDISNRNRVACFNKDGSLRWQYIFKDSVENNYQKLNTFYGPSYIIGVTSVNGKQIIVLSVRNMDNFHSAIYCLELESGTRIGTTLWNSGYIMDGMLHDIDNDRKIELVYTFNNNGFNNAGVAVIEFEKASGQGPTTNVYKLNNIILADFKAYILLPRTDLNYFVKARRNGIYLYSLSIKENFIIFNTVEDGKYNGFGLTYKLSFDLNSIHLFPIDEFVAIRDDLVKKKILALPLTDTKEYCELIKSQILYWNGKEFVKRNQPK